MFKRKRKVLTNTGIERMSEEAIGLKLSEYRHQGFVLTAVVDSSKDVRVYRTKSGLTQFLVKLSADQALELLNPDELKSIISKLA